MDKPQRLIITLLMGNELANISISAVCATIFQSLLPDNRWAPVLIVTMTLMIFGEISPKSLAISRPMEFSRVVSAPLLLFGQAITPVRFFVELIGAGLSRLIGDSSRDRRTITEAEFRQLAHVGLKEGVLEQDEADMIRRVFDLGEITVDTIMTPRKEMVAFPIDTPIPRIIDNLRLHRFSRVPVFEETIDNVVGILHANDLLRQKLTEPATCLEEMCRDPLYIPGSMKADDLIAVFRKHRSHLAIVIDEYGQTAGLVTLDDVLGELFGELLAERADENFTYHVCEDGDLIVAGSMDLDQFGLAVNQSFASEPVETVGGLVFHHFGHIPAKGEVIVIRKLRFTVLSIKENRIWRLRVGKGAKP